MSSPGKKTLQSPTKPRPSAMKELEGRGTVKKEVVVAIVEEEAVTKEVNVDQIDEFFGDGKKSSRKAHVEQEDDDEEESCELESEDGEGVECVWSAADSTGSSSSSSLDMLAIRTRRDKT